MQVTRGRVDRPPEAQYLATCAEDGEGRRSGGPCRPSQGQMRRSRCFHGCFSLDPCLSHSGSGGATDAARRAHSWERVIVSYALGRLSGWPEVVRCCSDFYVCLQALPSAEGQPRKCGTRRRKVFIHAIAVVHSFSGTSLVKRSSICVSVRIHLLLVSVHDHVYVNVYSSIIR